MTNKFSMSFKPSGQVADNGENTRQDKFIRSKQDNGLLYPLQIKDNFFDIVDENAVLWGDYDGIPYKCASSVEEDFIIVKKIKEESLEDKKLVLPKEQEFKNKTEFKGKTKGNKIGSGSFLYDINLSREVAGLEPYNMEDFEITQSKRLKYEKGATIDGIKFENSLDVCKYYIDKWLDACLVQSQLKKLRPVVGSGITHRHSVLVPHQYKSNRSEVRPILLSEARQHLIDNYDTVVAPKLLEADEVVDAVCARAYDHARATGSKIKAVKSANDKDSRSKRGVLQDWAKTFHFNNPQCWLIKDFDEDVGYIEMKKGEIKGGGSVFFAYQILMGDQADEYSPRKYLPEGFEHFGKGYGDESFYKDFAGLKTSHDVWQLVVDKYHEWFPHGLIYTAWDGTEVDEDTLSYLQKHYQLAYMLEGKDDKSTIMDLLDRFEVDYSKITNNNLYYPPQKVYIGNEKHTQEVMSIVESILKEDMVGIKALKKADIGERIDLIKSKLESISFESHFEMKQFEKENLNGND